MAQIRRTPLHVPPTHARPAFTLIELLIVLSIIGALMALGMVVGRQVVAGSKARVTEQLITTLDQSIDSYVADKGKMPPPVYSLAVTVGGAASVYDFPAIDGRPAGTKSYDGIVKDKNWFSVNDATVPSMATYAAILKQSALSESILKAVPSKFVRTRFLDQWYDGTSNSTSTPKDFLEALDDTTGKKIDVQSFEVIDPWGRPIRFVHPGYGGEEFFDGPSGNYMDPANKNQVTADGIKRAITHSVYVRWGKTTDPAKQLQFRRSYQPFLANEDQSKLPTGDADEGLCPTRRPYFYSAGPDGDPGQRADNIYTTRPEFPEETASLDTVEN